MWGTRSGRISVLLLIVILAAVGIARVIPSPDLLNAPFHENEASAVPQFRLTIPGSSAPVMSQPVSLKRPVEAPKYLSVPVHQVTTLSLPVLLSAFLC